MGGAEVRGKARVVRPNRSQLAWDLVDPDAWLPVDHMGRLVWAFVATLDLEQLYDKWMHAKASRDGRRPILPCSWRCGCWRPSRASARRASWIV